MLSFFNYKESGSHHFCGDCHPQNQQTRRDAFSMLLIDNVLNAIGQV
jgi:hypothetical protein